MPRIPPVQMAVWREYGVIGVLLAVAIGGYLYVSRQEEDLLANTLDSIGIHLLSLVPESGEKARFAATLDRFEARVQAREIEPEAVERFAASVFNLGGSGATLTPEEAEMVLSLSVGDESLVPRPARDSGAPAVPGSPPPTATRRPPPPTSAFRELGERLDPMLAFYEKARTDLPVDTSAGLSVRFSSDGGLRVVVDDRFRESVEAFPSAGRLARDRTVTWRPMLADASAAERERLSRMSRRLVERAFRLDSLHIDSADSVDVKRRVRLIASLRRLDAFGVESSLDLDSLASRLEADVERIIERIALDSIQMTGGPDSTGTSSPVTGSGGN